MLSVGSLVNPGLLQFLSGTLGLTNSNLAIGPSGLFGASLAIRSDQRIEVVNDFEVSAGGELCLQGGALAAGSLANSGFITGTGRIEGPLTNGPGEIEVGPGERLRVAGPAVNDGGQMTLGGGALHFEQTLTNTGGGLVVGNGMLRADGGMTNQATMAFSGVANVIGDVQNEAGGLIIASGGGPTTFFDDVTNAGEIRVSAGAMAVFFGELSGSGCTGSGTVYLEGDLKPGSSPGIMGFGGNVIFGQGACLEMELGGSDNSNPLAPQYDCLAVAGEIALGGDLDVTLLSGFTPKFGDEFTLIDGLALSGEFSSTSLPSLGGGLEWLINRTTSDFVLSVALLGDADMNGVVDAADYIALKRHMGQGSGAARANGDLDRDGDVDFNDLQILMGNFGAVGGSAPATTPEPATLALLALGGLVMLRRRRAK
jgi:hypothetical protein